MTLTAQCVDAVATQKSHPVNGVLLVGIFLSVAAGNRGVGEYLADRLAASGWKVITTSSCTGRLGRVIDMLRTVWRKRRSYQVAYVELYSGPAFFWGAAVCLLLRCLGKPYILTLHGGNLPAFSEKWPGSTRVVLQSASAVTAPSAYLVEKLRHLRPDIRLLPNAIDMSRYSFRLRGPVQPKLVWVRAFHKIYDPSQAVRVVALLTGEFPEIELVMVGPDKGDGSLEAARTLAAALGVERRIQYAGRVAKAEVGHWIDRGDIFLSTSTIDNNPVTLLEAMACGACVVSTKVGGIPYVVEHGTDALLVQPGDARAMANAVATLLRQPDLATSLSVNARRKVERLDWAAVLPQWHSLLFAVSQRNLN